MIAMLGLGLRGKSVLALIIACLCALAPAVLIGGLAVKEIRDDFGEAFARNFNDLSRQGIAAPLNRDLALSIRLANSELVRRFLANENDHDLAQLFFAEMDGYRDAFVDRCWFLISRKTLNYYFRDEGTVERPARIVTLEHGKTSDQWFFSTVAGTETYNINIDPDERIHRTKVWYNVIVRDAEGRKIGLAGSGMDLSRFMDAFLARREAGTTPVIIDDQGRIQAHPNRSLISMNSGSGASTVAYSLFNLIDDDKGRAALKAMMASAENAVETVQIGRIGIGGKTLIVADSFVPELRWHILTLVDADAAQILRAGWVTPAAATFVLLLALLLFAFGWAIEPLVLRPLRRLQSSAGAIARGNYMVDLPAPGKDEIGELTKSFVVMAEQVRQNTEDLERKVGERTAALEASNRRIVEALRKLDASIDYAGLIQRAILPDRQMIRSLGAGHFVLWRPRDVVGGDFYVFQPDGENSLIGIVDCAGHGVPGALMTMLARAAIDHALRQAGPRSPAEILTETDRAMRTMLEGSAISREIAVNMDAGMVYVDRKEKRLRFAGAKVSLYRAGPDAVEETVGDRRALVDRKTIRYKDHDLDLRADSTYYLTTDGFLDQAGGETGFGFGKKRFAAMLMENAGLPLEAQLAAFESTLAAYQGDRPQRDDITVLSFRFD